MPLKVLRAPDFRSCQAAQEIRERKPLNDCFYYPCMRSAHDLYIRNLILVIHDCAGQFVWLVSLVEDALQDSESVVYFGT